MKIIHEAPSWWGRRIRKLSIFDAFGEAYLCLLKGFLLIKHAVEKCLKKLFLGIHILQKVPKHVWIWHC